MVEVLADRRRKAVPAVPLAVGAGRRRRLVLDRPREPEPNEAPAHGEIQLRPVRRRPRRDAIVGGREDAEAVQVRRPIEVVEVDGHQHERRREWRAQLAEPGRLGDRAVARHAGVQHLDALAGRAQPILELARERVLHRLEPAEGHRVAEHQNAAHAGRRLRRDRVAIPEPEAVHVDDRFAHDDVDARRQAIGQVRRRGGRVEPARERVHAVDDVGRARERLAQRGGDRERHQQSATDAEQASHHVRLAFDRTGLDNRAAR